MKFVQGNKKLNFYLYKRLEKTQNQSYFVE